MIKLGFRIEGKALIHPHPLGGKIRPASDEEVALWEALRRAETVAEAAEAASRHGSIGDSENCARCGARRPWTRTLCNAPLGDAVAVWREGKHGQEAAAG